MKNLLENDFVRHYGKEGGKYHLSQDTIQGSIALHDPIACGQCLNFFRSQCQHETLKIRTTNHVNVANYEEFVNLLGIAGEKCDILIYDSTKLVLLDLTCSMEHYLGEHYVNGISVQGKRMKARNQIAKSIEQLYAVQTLADRIDAYLEKEAILAFRVKDEDLFRNVPKIIERSERVWMAMARQNENRQLKMPMPHGFNFLMVRYPKEYQW